MIYEKLVIIKILSEIAYNDSLNNYEKLPLIKI